VRTHQAGVAEFEGFDGVGVVDGAFEFGEAVEAGCCCRGGEEEGVEEHGCLLCLGRNMYKKNEWYIKVVRRQRLSTEMND
jgi:hypothetical protein